MQSGPRDRYLIRRLPSSPLDVSYLKLYLEEFKRFAANCHISLDGINVNKLLYEIAIKVKRAESTPRYNKRRVGAATSSRVPKILARADRLHDFIVHFSAILNVR